MKISALIPTYNRREFVPRAIQSILAQTVPVDEIIVVDDGSTDETAHVVARRRESGLPVTCLYQDWARMGAARHRGIQVARGEILAFTDDDCTVEPGWLTALVDTFQAHPEALGVQGRTVTVREAMTPFTRQVEQLESGHPYRTCNIAYRASVVRELGGFDPHLIRGEDVVLAMRVLERDAIVFAPDAVVVHPPRPKEWADRNAWRSGDSTKGPFSARKRRRCPYVHPVQMRIWFCTGATRSARRQAGRVPKHQDPPIRWRGGGALPQPGRSVRLRAGAPRVERAYEFWRAARAR